MIRSKEWQRGTENGEAKLLVLSELLAKNRRGPFAPALRQGAGLENSLIDQTRFHTRLKNSAHKINFLRGAKEKIFISCYAGMLFHFKKCGNAFFRDVIAHKGARPEIRQKPEESHPCFFFGQKLWERVLSPKETQKSVGTAFPRVPTEKHPWCYDICYFCIFDDVMPVFFFLSYYLTLIRQLLVNLSRRNQLPWRCSDDGMCRVYVRIVRMIITRVRCSSPQVCCSIELRVSVCAGVRFIIFSRRYRWPIFVILCNSGFGL